ncbi:hypothetical protein LOTGIDRAFT_163197 [Lottia gigantea]|uniref:Uncharacterized protein n=1 Tax=Lottia gigantea TaxID=225164 RepID=V4AET6_LOTGI|nr:hypothetical protein LOTGIDRAFT_163197 [Lottia gigantea]ESO91836.1 hypothetical protein LOTGIDRAFT_163197 [Lottia gigantea]
MANKILDPIFRLYDPIRYSFNKKKEDYIIISPTVGSKSQLNDGGRITFEINSLSNWLLLSDAYFRCDFKIKDAIQNQVPQTNTTLENNFFPSLFSEMVLEAGSNPIETIKHPGEFDTMLQTVLYPKDFDSVSGWIPDVGDGSILKEPVRNIANDADLARVRAVARNTIERVGRVANHGFEKRVLQYNNVVENNRWGNYVNWKLYPLFGLLEHRKVSIGLPYKIHLQREINDDKIFFAPKVKYNIVLTSDGVLKEKKTFKGYSNDKISVEDYVQLASGHDVSNKFNKPWEKSFTNGVVIPNDKQTKVFRSYLNNVKRKPPNSERIMYPYNDKDEYSFDENYEFDDFDYLTIHR